MNTTINKTVSLGKPITAPCLIPVEHKSTPNCINVPFIVNGVCYKVTAMSFGSPHGAVVVDDVDAVDVEGLGAGLGTHALFPQGASIVFLQVLDKETLKARLWQQGTGETPYTVEAAGVAGTAVMMLENVLADEVKVLMGDNVSRVSWNRRTGEVNCAV